MSSVIAAGGAGKERQKRSTSAAVMRATSMRDGAFSSRLMVGWEHRSRPLSGARPTAIAFNQSALGCFTAGGAFAGRKSWVRRRPSAAVDTRTLMPLASSAATSAPLA